MNKVKLAAHRGFSARYPENTMIAFREALKLDIDMIEMDVHMTKDGELVLIHDHTLDRTTNGTGLVRDYTLAELSALDAGSWKGEEFKGEKIPTLREFLELMKDNDLEINVELKDYPNLSGAFAYESCDKAMAMLAEFNMLDRIYINSFSGDMLNYVSTKYPSVRLHGYYPVRFHGAQFNENLWDKCFCVCLFNFTFDEDGKQDGTNNHIVCDQAAFDRVAAHGAERWHYYKEDTDYRISTALERGATGFTCNDPITAAALLRKYGAR